MITSTVSISDISASLTIAEHYHAGWMRVGMWAAEAALHLNIGPSITASADARRYCASLIRSARLRAAVDLDARSDRYAPHILATFDEPRWGWQRV